MMMMMMIIANDEAMTLVHKKKISHSSLSVEIVAEVTDRQTEDSYD